MRYMLFWLRVWDTSVGIRYRECRSETQRGMSIRLREELDSNRLSLPFVCLIGNPDAKYAVTEYWARWE